MGWWGYGPMEGDEPGDIEHALLSVTAEQPQSFATIDVLKLAELQDRVEDPLRFWQVLAVMVMRHGGELTAIKAKVLESINTDISERSIDFINPAARIASMTEFRQLVESYVDGTPVVVKTMTLMDKYFEAAKQGAVTSLNTDASSRAIAKLFNSSAGVDPKDMH